MERSLRYPDLFSDFHLLPWPAVVLALFSALRRCLGSSFGQLSDNTIASRQ